MADRYQITVSCPPGTDFSEETLDLLKDIGEVLREAIVSAGDLPFDEVEDLRLKVELIDRAATVDEDCFDVRCGSGWTRDV